LKLSDGPTLFDLLTDMLGTGRSSSTASNDSDSDGELYELCIGDGGSSKAAAIRHDRHLGLWIEVAVGVGLVRYVNSMTRFFL